MALMEVVLEQTFAGQQCINRWNYVASGVPASVTYSFALTFALGAIFDEVAVPPGYPAAEMMRIIAAIQQNNVTFENITVKNLYSVTDFYSTPFVNALTGDQAGEANSPISAFGFYTNRVRTDIRRATKRFAGVAEAAAGSQGIITGGQLALMLTLANKMSANLTYDDAGNTLTFAPAVLGKQRYDPDSGNPSPTGRAYRYYPTEAEQLTKVAQGVIWNSYDTVRSQVSRQYGRGR